EVDHLLDRSGVAAAELGRPARHQPAGVEQLALPLLGPVGQVGARQLGLAHLLVWRLVGVEPVVQLAAEGLGFVVPAQAHRPHDRFSLTRASYTYGLRVLRRAGGPAGHRPPLPRRAGGSSRTCATSTATP